MFRRNTYLWSVIVIGAIVTTVGGTGIFAVFTDRANQGPNTIESGPRWAAADIAIAESAGMVAGAFDCGTWKQHIITAMWSVADAQPGSSFTRYLCLVNVGTTSVDLSLSAIDLADNDPSCTYEEATVNPNCGGTDAGQLSPLLDVVVETGVCDEVADSSVSAGLASLASQPLQLSSDSLPVQAIECFAITVNYPTTTPEASIQAAQSDGVSWKFAFDAVATE